MDEGLTLVRLGAVLVRALLPAGVLLAVAGLVALRLFRRRGSSDRWRDARATSPTALLEIASAFQTIERIREREGAGTQVNASVSEAPLEPHLSTSAGSHDVGFSAGYRRKDQASSPSGVDCTVFAPRSVLRGERALLQLLLHRPPDGRMARAKALEYSSRAGERAHRPLVMDAPLGAVFALEVDVDGFEIPERRSEAIWNGSPQAVAFGFVVPRRCRYGMHLGRARVSIDGRPVGRIDFGIEVGSQAEEAELLPAGDRAGGYRSCFCSYSSLDRAETLKRAQGLQAAGLEVFIDALSLRPGDKWSDEIFQAIDRCDLFVLMWSQNARDSKWVRKEARYALERAKRHQTPDFRPVPIEGPPIAPVPRNLRARHFDDQLLGLIRRAELDRGRRRQASDSNDK